MTAVRGVMWLSRDAPRFRAHVAHHTMMAKANRGLRTPDPRNAIAWRVERQVRDALAAHFPPASHAVLRWEARDLRNRWVQKFREHDGVFDCADGTRLVLEVKSSASRSSIDYGLGQLRASLALTRPLTQRTVGLLAVANLGALSELFGKAAADPLEDYFPESSLLVWPPHSVPAVAGSCFVTLVPDDMVRPCLPEPVEVVS